MCGITGWIDLTQNLTSQVSIVKNMAATLTPRGPDDSGIWSSTHAVLTHKRLAVIDPVGGKQPLQRKIHNQNYILLYNGELYNAQDLKHELKSAGYEFHTSCDTEIVLISYIHWGTDCLNYLNGIFAFAVWQEKKQTLFLARDRLGIKPLFYSQINNSLLFASEIKAILKHPYISAEINQEGLAEIFFIGPARTPGHGVFCNIHEVKPGHYLLWQQGKTKISRYWQLKSQPHTDSLKQTIAAIQELLHDSARRQMVSDVPIGTFLSGGLDSSILTAYAAKANKGQLITYSVDYHDNDLYFKPNHFQPNSDSYWIDLMQKQFQTKHTTIVLKTEQLLEGLKDAVLARDLPGMADVDASFLLFCREIKKEVTVMLSGECADEIFGGYPWFHSEKALDFTGFPWSRSLEQRKELLLPDLISEIKPEEYVEKRKTETLAEVPYLDNECENDRKKRELFYLNYHWFMTTLLDRTDRMSMSAGLEVRVPFCDHRLVEYVWNIPWSMKAYSKREKGLLREAVKGLLPEEVRIRKKSPYPKTHNPAYLQGIQKKLKTILQDPEAPIHQIINPKYVKQLLQTKQDLLTVPFFGQLMTGPQLLAYLYQINIWLTEYKISLKL